MDIIKLSTDIPEGDNKEVKILYEGNRRKLIQITLRNNYDIIEAQSTRPHHGPVHSRQRNILRR